MSDGIDLFSGARGWEARAASSLGLDLLGIEWWEPACKTSEAAGLRVLQADIAELDPADFAHEMPESGGRILAGSPPCPTFSNAGSGAGRHLTALLVQCLRDLAAGRDTRAETREAAFAVLSPVAWKTEQTKARKANREPDREKSDERARRDAVMSVLVVEPLRWALTLKPRAIVMEQVPDVLKFWKVIGEILGALGYSWWAGVLEAERFGVPQTRERAILIARRDGLPAHPPEPTHHRFVPGEPRPADEVGLFGEIKSWVSMAEALGWGMTERPSVTVAAKTGATGGHRCLGGGSGAMETLDRAQDAGAWELRSGQTIAGGEHARRAGDEPAVTVTGRADLNRWEWANRPTPTVTGGGTASGGAEPFGSGARKGLESMRDAYFENPYPSRVNAARRHASEPAPTITAGNDTVDRVWTTERPATNVNADARISPPGRHDPAVSGSQQRGAIRVTVEEAAALQSFPHDWPWQGTRTAQFTQVGNAVPPLLGEAVLRTVLPAERWRPSPPT